MDRHTGMAVFAKVVETASFSRAARHFDMSPALVSKHVQVLEDRLGVRLLNRTTRHVSPTDAGLNFYERCVHIISELEEAERAVGDARAAPRGWLRVVAHASFGTHRIAPAIADYLSLYPEVSVELWLDDSDTNLLEKRVDVAIRLGPLSDSSLMARKLCMLEIMLCATPRYVEKSGTPETPSDLAKHNCLIHSFHHTQQAEWSFVDPAGKEETVHISGRFRADSSDSIMPLVHRHVGITLAPDYVLEDDLNAGRLIRLLPRYKASDIPVHAIYPPTRYLPAKTRTFLDFLTSRFARSSLNEKDATPKPETS
jgi:DNA-binding transcriptional LysR family regulator